MNYKYILIDLDDTILDTRANTRNALKEMSEFVDFPFNDEQIQYWYQMNDYLWKQLEEKQISRQELMNSRFPNLFRHFNKKIDTTNINQQYFAVLNQQHELMPGAKKTLQELNKTYRLFAASNGTSDKQYSQTAGAKIDQYFEKIFLSENIGFDKPDKKFFESIESELQAPPKDFLMIGDSLSSDIAGANDSDIDSLWYNKNKKVNQSHVKPIFEVTSLPEIINILQ
ncbi:YjjG family noncanonical pyrimidine nucleotidase [Companilactobacillus futsaii]|uniref:Noncanonical pyrimidine nucleotidase, YjjG family n=2 Tax=Companilactobacillus futsaii TaxID=938155 RepID=A0A5B7SXL8_9LACO|nr:YjjG family noncanonical pyrimidine nucleotidase [Companilactobacillus futsaii]KRK90570.1 HAD superfamily hydrolase [Companilactobacillus futsaii JCM 17355]QCX24636.1 noncanonical pyrimidine nucleotidase, YjjG family [Companilactobacillus futsaii]